MGDTTRGCPLRDESVGPQPTGHLGRDVHCERAVDDPSNRIAVNTDLMFIVHPSPHWSIAIISSWHRVAVIFGRGLGKLVTVDQRREGMWSSSTPLPSRSPPTAMT